MKPRCRQKAIASGQDEVTALIALLDAGHSASAEWALVRAAEMPPERSAPVWRHLLGKIDAGNPDERPAATVVSGVVRELAKTDPASVEALGKRVDGDDLLEAALMLGLWESNAAAAPAPSPKGPCARIAVVTRDSKVPPEAAPLCSIGSRVRRFHSVGVRNSCSLAVPSLTPSASRPMSCRRKSE